MDSLTGVGALSASDWRTLGDLTDQLEQAWKNADEADLSPLLPTAGDRLRANALVELIKTDLEIRWRRLRGLPLEHYLERFPELGSKDQLPLPLIYEEYRVRQLFGDHVQLADYRERFPRQFEEFQRLVQNQPVATLRSVAKTPSVAKPAPVASPMVMEPEVVLPLGGGYKREKLIGRGGFGEVWKATAPGGFPVAIKVITRPADHEERLREEKSLEVVKSLTHHFLIRTHAFYAEQDRLYIIMDLADSSLRDRFKECRKQGEKGIPKAELLSYFKESAEALDYLHDKDVLHRDIKPDNILLMEGHVRLADFGLLRRQDQNLVSVSGSGTPAYMAPEVWRGHASRQSDQYSLAYAYAELFMGRRPFSSTDYAGVMLDHLDRVPDLEGLSAAEQEVLFKALEKDPDNRYASCTEFVRALAKAAGGISATEISVPEPRATNQQKVSRGKMPSVTGKAAAVTNPRREREGTLGPRTSQGSQRSQGSQESVTFTDDGTHASLSQLGKARNRRWWLAGVLIVVAGLLGVGGWIFFGPTKDETKPPPDPTKPGIEEAKKPPIVPKGFKSATDEIVEDDRKQRFFKVIVTDRTDCPPIRFVLIPKQRDDDPPSFYLMETKVSNEVFAAFATVRPLANEPLWGLEMASFPALGMTAERANACAVWLGGHLPTTRQWDKAAGFWDRNGREGPAKGSRVAIARRGKGPLPVNAPGEDDLSVFGVRGMAGNGTELTRDVLEQGGAKKLVILRGQRFEASQPLSFADLEEQQRAKDAQVQYYNVGSRDTGFRVVVEMP